MPGFQTKIQRHWDTRLCENSLTGASFSSEPNLSRDSIAEFMTSADAGTRVAHRQSKFARPLLCSAKARAASNNKAMGTHRVEQDCDELKVQAFMNALLDDLRALDYLIENDKIESGVRRIGDVRKLRVHDFEQRGRANLTVHGKGRD